MSEIRCCPNHDERLTPLIFTMAFDYKELWCPYCGYGCGYFGETESVESSKELRERLKQDTRLSKNYIFAQSCKTATEVRYRGKWYRPNELPSSIKNKNELAIKNWTYAVANQPKEQ